MCCIKSSSVLILWVKTLSSSKNVLFWNRCIAILIIYLDGWSQIGVLCTCDLQKQIVGTLKCCVLKMYWTKEMMQHCNVLGPCFGTKQTFCRSESVLTTFVLWKKWSHFLSCFFAAAPYLSSVPGSVHYQKESNTLLVRCKVCTWS